MTSSKKPGEPPAPAFGVALRLDENGGDIVYVDCDCDCATYCPQGKTGTSSLCRIAFKRDRLRRKELRRLDNGSAR